ncbi:MAG: phosphate ABC transporter permease family protein, partial [Pseudomonadota bacterium]
MISYTFVLVLLMGAGFLMLTRSRAFALADGQLSSLHSRPGYHGLHSFLWVVLVGIACLLLLSMGGSILINAMLMGDIRSALPDAQRIEHQLVISDAKAMANGGVASRNDALREQ